METHEEAQPVTTNECSRQSDQGNSDRRKRLLDICIKSSSRTAVVDIKPEDREALEEHRKVREDRTNTRRRER